MKNLKYQINDKVEHDIFGKGTVTNVQERVEGAFTYEDLVTVKFDKPIVHKQDGGWKPEPKQERTFTTSSLTQHDVNRWENVLDDEEEGKN